MRSSHNDCNKANLSKDLIFNSVDL